MLTKRVERGVITEQVEIIVVPERVDGERNALTLSQCYVLYKGKMKVGVVRHGARSCGRSSLRSLAFEPAKRPDERADYCPRLQFSPLMQAPGARFHT